MIKTTKTLARMRELIGADLDQATERQVRTFTGAALIVLAENVEHLTAELKVSLELHRAAVYQGLDELRGRQT